MAIAGPISRRHGGLLHISLTAAAGLFPVTTSTAWEPGSCSYVPALLEQCRASLLNNGPVCALLYSCVHE